MTKRDHLIPELITDINGKRTKVYRKPKSKVSVKSNLALTAVPPSAIKHIDIHKEIDRVNDSVPDPDEEKASTPIDLAFKSNREWGISHLNRRNFRIARGLRTLDEGIQKNVVATLSDDTDFASKDYSRAIATSLDKWERIANIDDLNVEADDDLHSSSEKRYALLTNMADNRKICTGIANEINRIKSEGDPDVDPSDVHLTVELIRDSTSNRDAMLQVRTYAIRNKRQDLLEEIDAIQRQVIQVEVPLRALVLDGASRQYGYYLGGDDDDAKVEFTPRKNFSEKLARKDLSSDELKQITIKKQDFGLLRGVVGDERYESYRIPGTTAVTIK